MRIRRSRVRACAIPGRCSRTVWMPAFGAGLQPGRPIGCARRELARRQKARGASGGSRRRPREDCRVRHAPATASPPPRSSRSRGRTCRPADQRQETGSVAGSFQTPSSAPTTSSPSASSASSARQGAKPRGHPRHRHQGCLVSYVTHVDDAIGDALLPTSLPTTAHRRQRAASPQPLRT
jgi:hypothetical protein